MAIAVASATILMERIQEGCWQGLQTPTSASGSWKLWRSFVRSPSGGGRIFSGSRQRRSWVGLTVNANAYSTFETLLDRMEIR
eukprot:2858275-Pyramimonas_sp.AAC.1